MVKWKWEDSLRLFVYHLFLNIGMNSAIFKQVGKVPWVTHKLKKSLSGVEMTYLLSLINLVSMSNYLLVFWLLS